MALWTPAEIATRIWIDFADAATVTTSLGNIVSVTDKSGNGFGLSSESVGSRPAYQSAAINGLNVARFAGSQNLNFSVPAVPLAHSMFLVFKNTASLNVGSVVGQWASGQTGRFVIASNQNSAGVASSQRINPFNSATTNGAGSAGLMLEFTATNTVMMTSNCETGSEGWQVYKDGTAVDSATVTALYQGVNTAIGKISASTSVNYYVGDFCELLILSGKASISARQIAEGYMAWKWGLQGNLPADHPYKNAAPSTGSSTAAVHFFTFGF